ncbi:MAG: coenzyme F420-0:L-glutamate ligase [Nocardioides sp.]
MTPRRLIVTAPDDVGEVTPGTDLASTLLAVAAPGDGDIVVVTSKVVSKAEGRIRPGPGRASLDQEAVRVVARADRVVIVRSRLGITVANAGIDESNVPGDQHLLLPEDPDRTAAELRDSLRTHAGVNVGVLISDSAGRAWRIGQTELAIGAAGITTIEDHRGTIDPYGKRLDQTRPCVADELCSAAELVTGKLTGRPFAIVTGRADLVLPVGRHGPGAAGLNRPDADDLFGYGAREAVVRAFAGDGDEAYGAAASTTELLSALDSAGVRALEPLDAPRRERASAWTVRLPERAVGALIGLVRAHGWDAVTDHAAHRAAVRATADERADSLTELRIFPRSP